MNLKQDTWPNISKGKWPSLDMHAEKMISLRHAFSELCLEKKNGAPHDVVHRQRQETVKIIINVYASLEEKVRMADDRTAWRKRSCATEAANIRSDAAD